MTQLVFAPLAVLIAGLLSIALLEGVLKIRDSTISAYICYLVEGSG